MGRITASRWQRLALGTAIVAAGAVLLIARPGIALAHHVTVTESASCASWSTKAEYIGGPEDRKIVVDVMVNAEHIAQTFYFDNAAGHLGHQDYYMLYQRTGAGSLHTSGTITMYQKVDGAYTSVASVEHPAADVTCDASATPASARTATRPPATRTANSTATVPANTPSTTSTVEIEGTATPQPTDTPPPTGTPQPTDTPQTTTTVTTDESVTPLATDTATAAATSTTTATTVAASSTSTPESSSTASSTGDIETPRPPIAPTLVSIVYGSTFPGQPGGDESPALPSERALPSTGQGSRTPGAVVAGLLGTLLAAIGLSVCATGLRTRRMG